MDGVLDLLLLAQNYQLLLLLLLFLLLLLARLDRVRSGPLEGHDFLG